jgi:dTDP-4-amino-4,6-dideoxygalactose transaminase
MGVFALAFQPPFWWLATRLGAQRVGDNEASWGYTMRGLTAPQAALGLATLPRLATINQLRLHHAEQLCAALQDVPGVTPVLPSAAQAVPIYLRFPLLATAADSLVQELNRAGIGAGRVYRRTLAEFFPPVAAPPLPGAEQVARTLLTLPTNHHLHNADVARIAAVIRGFP